MEQDAPAGATEVAPGSPAPPCPPPARAAPEPRRDAWLRLGHAPGTTPALVAALRRHEPDVDRLGAALVDLVAGDDALVAPLGPLSPAAAALLRSGAARRAVEVALEWEAGAPDRRLITLDARGEAPYPEAVACLDDAPPALALVGDPAALVAPGLAVVGSRRATRLGLELAREYAATFARRGVSIVSGLAHGIDAAAHEAALDVGGLTLAVVATGPDRTYPARHASLAARIAGAGGAWIAEHPCGLELRPYHFPHRNRLITALSLGTLVVQAADPSGTLGTAAHANAQSRAVMALPGPPGDPAFAGCHRLVREGAATLVAAPADVAATLRHHMTMLLDEDAREREVRRRVGRAPSARARAASAPHAPSLARLDEGLRAPGADAAPGAEPAPSAALGAAGEGARRVHAALGPEALDAGELAARTGLGIGPTAAALAHLEVLGLVARDGARGYVRCRAPGP